MLFNDITYGLLLNIIISWNYGSVYIIEIIIDYFFEIINAYFEYLSVRYKILGVCQCLLYRY